MQSSIHDKTLVDSKRFDFILAYWVSHIVSPPVVAIVLTCGLTFKFSDNPLKALLWLLLAVPFMAVPPITYIKWLVYIGYLEDFYMPNRAKRLLPATVTVIWLFMGWGLLHYWQAPVIVDLLAYTIVVLVTILTLITLLWKVSFHSATIGAAVTGTLLFIGSSTWPVILFVPLVGWSRVRLKRHTPSQVIVGCLVGILTAVIMFEYSLIHNLFTLP